MLPDPLGVQVPPPAPTLLDRLQAAGREIIGIGKIPDIFAHRGITHEIKAHGIDGLFQATLDAMDSAADHAKEAGQAVEQKVDQAAAAIEESGEGK